MKTTLLAVAVLALGGVWPALAVDPQVTNVSAHQDFFSRQVTISYDLSDADSSTVRIGVEISADDGASWSVPAASLAGTGVGEAVKPGNGRVITWNAPADWPGKVSANMRFRITASDDPPAPTGMAVIPAGSFSMGNVLSATGDGWSSELPVHTVYVSAFYMDRYEVTKALWDEVRAYGLTHGYTDLPAGGGKASSHPVRITWYSMVKWCNARSQRDNLVPVYYTNDAQTVLYQTGNVNVTNVQVKWAANGYRLPTEAEWEKAARGGLSGRRFPWGDADTITHSRANYNSSTSYSYDVSPTRGYHPTYNDGVSPYTSPVGAFAPNGYGLYDMAGNVWEWCWDWYGAYGSASQTDPQGPSFGSGRVARGGGWSGDAFGCRAAPRNFGSPTRSNDYFGFRCARGRP